jgi:protein-L-isoaspartate(D-aspartate) O-methyltransferase
MARTIPGAFVVLLCLTAGVRADDHSDQRDRMVATQLERRGIRDARVLAAMRKVPRHEFVPAGVRDRAHDDGALPIGHQQTISQPYIVALMTELAAVTPTSGYQAAVLAELASDVYSIEIVEPLAREAGATLRRLGYERVRLRTGDGYRGWPEAAPFDAIVVTAAPGSVPKPLLKQLAPGGRLVIPVGDDIQWLEVHRRTETGITVERTIPVRFVPMTGDAERGAK